MSKKVVLLILNSFIFISTTIVTIYGIINGAGDAQLGTHIIGWGYFIPFTMDSNILMGIISLIYLMALIKSIIKKSEMSHNIKVLYYVGTVSVTLTLLTVVFFLAPTQAIENHSIKSYFVNFKNDLFFFHFTNPIVAIISFFLMDSNKKAGIKENLWAVLPMAIYSIAYVTNVVFLKTWSDFYGFTFGGKMYLVPFVLIVMLGVTFLIGLILIKIKNKIRNN